ncbi:27097_t:CDS:2, partial [Racocetra persica]
DECFFVVIIGAFSFANIVSDLQVFVIAVGANTKILETINLVPPIDSASPTDNISLDIESGTSVAIVSASDSGK